MSALARRRHLLVAALAAAAAAACVFLPGPAEARLPFAIPLLLVLPGYAFAHAAFPPDTLDRVQVVLLALGLSLALSVVTATELAGAGVLQTESLASVMAGITVVASLVAQVRLGLHAPDAAPPAVGRRRRRVRPAAIALGAAAAVVLVAAIALARTPLPLPDDRGYTTMALTRDPGDVTRVLLRIESQEAHTRDFRLRVAASGEDVIDRPVRMSPGELLEMPLDQSPVATAGQITASLSTGSPSVVYRRVHLNLPVQVPAPPVTARSPGA
jgi:hypothetical protein